MDQQADTAGQSIQWHAVTTRSRHEKASSAMLSSLGIPLLLPLQSRMRQWSDRKQVITVPLFPGYIFVQVNPWSRTKLEVLKTPGITGFVANKTGPLPIPDDEIRNIRTVMDQGFPCAPHFFPNEGDRVRVTRGALQGLEGILIRRGAQSQLVLTVEMIQRSVSVTVDAQDVEVLSQ